MDLAAWVQVDFQAWADTQAWEVLAAWVDTQDMDGMAAGEEDTLVMDGMAAGVEVTRVMDGMAAGVEVTQGMVDMAAGEDTQAMEEWEDSRFMVDMATWVEYPPTFSRKQNSTL
ncbi:hypothetical protein BABA_06856 [Neobacillus bataviensis LMG 21833]|uniref:Uncharacterized protein n=1 Tax=Neobacillus bataviensis LMG 21833 TaxID=1117379 RepID=K6E9P3_9BACI|nr:hypothetical protein BABA_06856 [Neobacillus bataviensis LMG 21833]